MFLCLSIIPVLVLPIGWLEYRLLTRTKWGAVFALVNVAVLYGPWIVMVLLSPYRSTEAATMSAGLAMAVVALALWGFAAPHLFRARGEVETIPGSLATEGPYRFIRHPLYAGHILFIGGGVLASGALDVFLTTPILILVAAAAARYEESSRLGALFGDEFKNYKSRTPFLLPAWGWIIWGIIYLGAAIRLLGGVLNWW